MRTDELLRISPVDGIDHFIKSRYIMNHLFSIKDRVIVLTGGYGILGRCIAKHLAREGAKVAILGRNTEKGNRLKEEVRKLGGIVMFHAADVMRREQLEESRQAIVQAFGSIDVLINLAGGNMPGATIAPDQTFFDLDQIGRAHV